MILFTKLKHSLIEENYDYRGKDKVGRDSLGVWDVHSTVFK